MSAANRLVRVTRVFRKRITFTGAAGSGAVGTVTVATVKGAVAIKRGAVRVITDLAGATATIAMGTAANTAGLIAQSTATDLDAGKFWQDATPEAGVSPLITDKAVTGDIILTIGTAAISGGVIEVWFEYESMSDDGYMA